MDVPGLSCQYTYIVLHGQGNRPKKTRPTSGKSKAADQNFRFGAADIGHSPALMLLAVHVPGEASLLDGKGSDEVVCYRPKSPANSI